MSDVDPTTVSGSLVTHELTEDGVTERRLGRFTARPAPPDEYLVEYEHAPDQTYPPLPEED